MTLPSDEYGDLLRRAMRAEAESVVPSPEGLDIIRHRIDNRGLRGIIWWRIGASVAAATLVAGAVVMAVPDLRTQVTTQVIGAGADGGELPEAGSTALGPPPTEAPPMTIVTPGQTEPTVASDSTATAAPSEPAATAAASPNPCATPTATPTVVEPDPSGTDDCPPQENPSSSTPTTKPSPTATQSSSAPSPSPTPTGCVGDGCDPATPGPVSSDAPATADAPAAATDS